MTTPTLPELLAKVEEIRREPMAGAASARLWLQIHDGHNAHDLGCCQFAGLLRETLDRDIALVTTIDLLRDLVGRMAGEIQHRQICRPCTEGTCSATDAFDLLREAEAVAGKGAK